MLKLNKGNAGNAGFTVFVINFGEMHEKEIQTFQILAHEEGTVVKTIVVNTYVIVVMETPALSKEFLEETVLYLIGHHSIVFDELICT